MTADSAELSKHGPIDAFLDIGPPQASQSTHFKSAILALRPGARVSLMGGYLDDVAIPYSMIMGFSLRLYGKFMYNQSDVGDLVKLIEHGMLKLGEAGGTKVAGAFPLAQWKEALDLAAEQTGTVLIKP